jgi:uncharacterized protein YhbP (UPF0306 family)
MKLTKKLVLKFLPENRLMTLATYGSYPWIASVYYGFDKDLKLYFISDVTTRYGRQILKNKKVAVAIADSTQKPDSDKKGYQMFGFAALIRTRKETEKAIELWKKNVGIKTEKPDFISVKGRMWKITPKKIKYFNQALFKVDDGHEPILNL